MDEKLEPAKQCKTNFKTYVKNINFVLPGHRLDGLDVIFKIKAL